jgi:hypothetical protein
MSVTDTMFSTVTMVDTGFNTHSINPNQRVVVLAHGFNNAQRSSITVNGPRDGGVYPPGPGWLFISVNGVVSQGRRVIVGSGGNAPVSYTY